MSGSDTPDLSVCVCVDVCGHKEQSDLDFYVVMNYFCVLAIMIFIVRLGHVNCANR